MAKKATVMAVVNQKGGTGKTTTTENLGVGLAMEGKKVLVVDTDPQASLTISLGYPVPDELPTTLSNLMAKVMTEQPIEPGEGILHHPEGIDLMPSNIELSGLEVSLVNAMSRETILRQYLDTVKQNYDFILLDCMFTPKDIESALITLFDLLDPEVMEMLYENFGEEIDDISPDLLAKVFKEKADTICEYRAVSRVGDGIDYHGKLLFDQRAVNLLSYLESFVENERLRMICCTELWLLEDMRFAVVRYVGTLVKGGDDADCITEYRSFVKNIEHENDVFFSPEDLICELDDR